MHIPMLLSLALQGAAAQKPQLNPLQKWLGDAGMMPMLLLMFGVFYFIVMRPQQKKQQEHEAWQKSVGVGSEVVTTGGLIGKITHAGDDFVTLDVGEKVRIKVLRSAVTGPRQAAPADSTKDKASA